VGEADGGEKCPPEVETPGERLCRVWNKRGIGIGRAEDLRKDNTRQCRKDKSNAEKQLEDRRSLAAAFRRQYLGKVHRHRNLKETAAQSLQDASAHDEREGNARQADDRNRGQKADRRQADDGTTSEAVAQESATCGRKDASEENAPDNPTDLGV